MKEVAETLESLENDISLKLLISLESTLEKIKGEVSPHDLPSLTKRFNVLYSEIDELDVYKNSLRNWQTEY